MRPPSTRSPPVIPQSPQLSTSLPISLVSFNGLNYGASSQGDRHAHGGAGQHLHDRSPDAAPKGLHTLFDKPIAQDTPPTTLFPANAGLSTWLPPRFVPAGSIGSKPIPTNAWWGNLIAGSSDSLIQPVWTNPYALRPSVAAAPFGLSMSYPYSTRVFWADSGNGLDARRYYTHAVVDELVFSASQFTTAPTFKVTAWDDLSVSIQLAKSTSAKMDATLVPGMGFVSATYRRLTPRFESVHPIQAINGINMELGTSVTNTRFVIALGNGQRWALYTEKSITLTLRSYTALGSSGSYSGYVRAAIVTSDAQLETLDKSVGCQLTGSNIEAKDSSSYMFHLKTSGNCSAGLFHYLQVHHTDTLDCTSAVEVPGAVSNSATRGPMAGVLTLSDPPVIRFTETTSVPVDFYPPRKPMLAVVKAQKIKETLMKELDADWYLPRDGSYDFNSKAAHKYANLCLVANDSVVTGVDRAALKRKCLDKFEALLLPFVSNSWSSPLHYDTTYRGIVASIGLTEKSSEVDFGNLVYNDHHFHYGSWIATAAIVNFLDPTWSQLQQLNTVTKYLIRDVANPSRSDTAIPKFRQFDWFRGHSFSHGITPSADGKDQESSSQDINFHYAVALFAKATKNSALSTVSQVMLKVNKRAAQTYSLMTSDNRVHPTPILPNKVTGILFDNKADYTTWFSSDKAAIHGIQMIPVTPVTEFVRTPQFVKEEWDGVLSKTPDVVNNNVDNAWLSLIYTSYATVNKTLAMEKLQVVNLDDGLSRSWALYMAATRP